MSKSFSATLFTLRLVTLSFLLTLSLAAKPKQPIQKQPTPQRVAEIQKALADHGFASGKTWAETKEICRKIADDHGWQNMWAPDARVLIILGLGNANADASVINLPGNILDQDERKWVEENGHGQLKP